MRRPHVPADADTVIVQLEGDPLATAARTKPVRGEAIDFTSRTVQAYRAELAARREDFKRWLRDNAPKVEVVAEYDVVLNGVALRINGEGLETIRSAPMVKAAQHARAYSPTGA